MYTLDLSLTQICDRLSNICKKGTSDVAVNGNQPIIGCFEIS